MEKLIIQQGDSARIAIILPLDKMDKVQDVVCTVGNRLSYSLSKGTLTPTATANLFHLDIQSVQSQKHTGNLELVVAIDYSDIGVKKTKRAENLFVQVVRNDNYFNNNSISELVSAVVVVTVDEEVVTGIPILASYLVINSGGGGGATNLGYTASPTNGIVTSDTGTDATIPLANNTNAGLLSPSEKTAITHTNRNTLDLITEAFTTALKNAYDGAVTWITTNGTNVLAHLSRTDNPHSVTKTQVGLSNVDNTSDASKPISTATQTALNNKQNTLTAGNNITIVGDTISASGGGTITIDPTPTDGSTNAVSSNGVFDALAGKQNTDTVLYQNTNHNLTSSTSLQKIFNVGSSGNGSFPIASGLSYEFEATIYINDIENASATNINFGMLGNVSFCENIAYSVISTPAYTSFTYPFQIFKTNSFASLKIIDSASSADGAYYVKIYGTFRANANGIITPAIALPSQGGGIFVENGSTFKIRTIATSNTVI